MTSSQVSLAVLALVLVALGLLLVRTTPRASFSAWAAPTLCAAGAVCLATALDAAWFAMIVSGLAVGLGVRYASGLGRSAP